MIDKFCFYFRKTNFHNLWKSAVMPLILALAPVTAVAEPTEIKNSLGYYFYTDYGYFNELQNYEGEARPTEHVTMFLGGVKFASQINENFKLLFKPEFLSSTSFPQYPGSDREPDISPPSRSNSTYVEEGKGTWTMGDAARPDWEITLGYQYIKDNAHTKTFGDYLYRSRIYPSLLVTGFQKARAKILGLKVLKTHGDILSHNVVAHSQIDRYPYGDISLAYSATVTAGEMFEVGAGINWVSAIPMRPSRTTPAGNDLYINWDNTYKEVDYQEMTMIHDDSGQVLKYITLRPIALSDSTATLMVYDPAQVLTDSLEIPLVNGKVAGLSGGTTMKDGGMANRDAMDELTTDESKGIHLYPELQGKEVKFSYAGQIVTFKAAFNPLANQETGLGKDAFKIYMEAAVLGWKNYPFFYEERSERTAIMGGLYLPTFDFLDFLVAEVEYFPSKKPATWQQSERYNIPQPGSFRWPNMDQAYVDPDRQKRDDWKWILSGRKTINQGFGVWAQGGTDHLRSKTSRDNYQELSSNPSQWYVMVRLVFTNSL